MEKTVDELLSELIITRADYLDNQGSEDADIFYSKYFNAYNAYWKQVDPTKVKDMWN